MHADPGAAGCADIDIRPASVFMGSGFAAVQRPGMTGKIYALAGTSSRTAMPSRPGFAAG